MPELPWVFVPAASDAAGVIPQDAGVTVAQSKPTDDASRCATHETKAPWFGKPDGVGICAAVETRVPCVSALELGSGLDGAAALSDGEGLPDGSAESLDSGLSDGSADSLASGLSDGSAAADGSVFAATLWDEAGFMDGVAAKTAPAEMASTARAMPRPRKRRRMVDMRRWCPPSVVPAVPYLS